MRVLSFPPENRAGLRSSAMASSPRHDKTLDLPGFPTNERREQSAWQYLRIARIDHWMLYNVPPIRIKDYAYFDVLAESVNNPLRFLVGWFAVAPQFLPPSSVLLAYWMGAHF